eukprot:m.496892 g.496892  ORF g.496892 m.496892 type:complete len:90 (+) comp57307_c1_seq18:473-742(+)
MRCPMRLVASLVSVMSSPVVAQLQAQCDVLTGHFTGEQRKRQDVEQKLQHVTRENAVRLFDSVLIVDVSCVLVEIPISPSFAVRDISRV